MGACGASLLRVSDNKEESDILLTAAHCTYINETDINRVIIRQDDADKFLVYAGNHHIENLEAGEQQVESKRFERHPNYYNGNDLALVKLDTPVKFSDTIRPICLPEQEEAIPVAKHCMASGWGRINSHNDDYPENLMELKIPVHDDETCKKSWDFVYKENEMICSGPLDASAGVCKGDSGGMLACKQPGDVWTLYGVASFVARNEGEDDMKPITCLKKGKSAVFGRVSSYVNWIKENIAKMTSVK